jgi:hypothetical protein
LCQYRNTLFPDYFQFTTNKVTFKIALIVGIRPTDAEYLSEHYTYPVKGGGGHLKRLYIFILFMIVSYSVYYDLKAGTLPKAVETAVPVVNNNEESLPEETEEEIQIEYTSVKVKSGDTILSLMEEELDGPLPVSIDQLIEDFEFLNEGQSAQDIQVGKVYKLPIY